MEAAGIEPASRYVSTAASTRVVRWLIFAEKMPNKQSTFTTSSQLVLTRRVESVTSGDLELAAGTTKLSSKISRAGIAIMQPLLS